MHALVSTHVLAPVLVGLYYRSVVDLRTHLRRAARARWAKATPGQKKQAMAHALRAFWDGLTPEQRSAEMKRRAKVRNRNKARKAKRE
jgi:hypothetical protein